MNTFKVIVIGLAMMAAAPPAAWSQPEPRHGLMYETPPMVWDEALPLGNGILGALVWGDGAPLKISLDRTDLWDLRPVPQFESEDYSFDTMRQWVSEGRLADLHALYDHPYGNAGPTKIPAGRIEIASTNRRCSKRPLSTWPGHLPTSASGMGLRSGFSCTHPNPSD